MMRREVLCGIAIALLASVLPASADATVRRFALVAAANYGGASRPQLKYAASDAERFARVLADLGGVAPADAILLKQPTARELEDALAVLGKRVAGAGQDAGDGGARTEVLVYYSGHADESGLLLGDDRYAYRTLRDRLEAIPADVRIAVLDACASGAITRIKGGQARRPFLVDASSSMRGHAFLTSSSADEAAQESDRIGASFFTHFLISGLRGAADVSGEGMVTLGEAYQFAFRETLGRTVDTRGGAQHPSYDINLSGTGDVVMTDLRQTSAGLVLAEDVSGRCFIRDASQALVVELRKPKDRRVELGLEPGRHEVSCQDGATAFVARPTLHQGGRVVLGPSDFTPTRREATVARGEEWRPAIGELNGRRRLDVWWGLGDFGTWRLGSTSGAHIASPSEPDRFETIGMTSWVRPRLATSLLYSEHHETTTREVTGPVASDESSRLRSLLGTVRRDLPSSSPRFKPYATVGLGWYFRSATFRTTVSGPGAGDGTQQNPTSSTGSYADQGMGARFALGLDFQQGHHVMAGVQIGYDRITPFTTASGNRRDYSGMQYGMLTLGWLFGRGTPPKN